jgi:thiol-disulfide isomerase/thioredoxin
MRSLSSLKGKTVLLYFWSVYSDVSKQQNPLLEKIYKKYKNKGFEIYSVCVDKNPESWLKVIKFEDFSFINTFGPDFPDSETAHSYNMRSVPANYLLDTNGNIIGRDLYGAELEIWLENKL